MTISLFYTSSTNPTITTTAAAAVIAAAVPPSSSSIVLSSPQPAVVALKIHQEQEKEKSSSTLTSAATTMDDKCEKCVKGYEERWSRKQRLEWNLENTPFFRDGIYLLKATIFNSNDDEDHQNDYEEKDKKSKSNITLRITYTYQYSLSKFFSVFPGLSSVSEGIRTLWTFLDKHCLCKECGALLNKDIQEEKGCPSCEMFVGFSAFLDKTENCAICLEPVYRFTLPCGHKFHKLCMNSVKFEGHRNCPLCRAEIPYDVLCSIYDYDENLGYGDDEGYDEDNNEDDDDGSDDNDDEEE